ncbi:MAG: 4Fe-4S dicluster domain-containing protein [Candidatus Eremiobacteraeota bacterium]|nr:4Fe-4S dicluster domain-containing protein [Candidatus Eremiobacteraeota bacterium]
MIDASPHGFTGRDVPPASVYDQCVRCGLCLPTCPTYVETLVETSGPRGRIALIAAVDAGRLDLTSPGFVHQMSECLDCRACEAACPSGVAYGQLLEPARTQIRRATADREPPLRTFARAFALGLFARPAAMAAVARLLRFYQRGGVRAFARRSGALRALGLERLEALAPEISDRFFTPSDRVRASATQPAKATAFLHAGCIVRVAFAAWNDATARVLQRCGCDVVSPPSQGCCGAIAIHAGEMDRGRALAKRNIAAFERSGADVYVVNAAGCGSALKEYGHLLADEPAWAARAAAFSACVRDVTEYLDDIGLAPGLGPLAGTVTYQEPCHLAHAQRIAAAPRRLLASIPGLTLREMNESSLCCGSAGTYNITQPDMSDRLLARKVDNVRAVAPDVVATANPGCALALRNGLRDGAPVAVKHIVELLDDAYEAYSPTSRASSARAASTLG